MQKNEIINKLLETEKYLWVDAETTGLGLFDTIISLSVLTDKGFEYFFQFNPETEFTFLELKEILRNVFSRTDIYTVAHNVKFDVLKLQRAGIPVYTKLLDTCVLIHLLDENRDKDLKTVMKQEFNEERFNYNETIAGNLFDKDGLKKKNLQDVRDHKRVFEYFIDKLKKDKKLYRLFMDLECPITKVLVDMEMNGVKIDIDYLETFNKKIAPQLRQLEERAKKITGNPNFLLSSPQQISDYLFNQKGLKPLKNMEKGKNGFYSVKDDVLQMYQVKDELAKIRLDYAGLASMQSNHIVKCLDLARKDPNNSNRVYPEFNQSNTPISRLSCSNPNMQNMTRPDENSDTTGLRRMVIPEKGNLIVKLDYEQLELRLMAYFSKDPFLCDAFMNGKDVHQKVIDDFDKKFGLKINRTGAKGINFGLQYCGTAQVLIRTGVPEKDAYTFCDAWYSLCNGVVKFQAKVAKEIEEKGFVTNMFGRIRRLGKDTIPEYKKQKLLEGKAIYTPKLSQGVQFIISSSSTDIVKIGMRNHYNRMQELINKDKKWNEAKMILQVHDELVWEVKKDLVNEFKSIAKSNFENPVKLSIPILCKVSVGENYENLN